MADAESELLSTVLYAQDKAGEAFSLVTGHIKDEMFLKPEAKFIYKLMKEMCKEGDIEILGYDSFIRALIPRAQMEYGNSGIITDYLCSLAVNFNTTPTTPYWIKKVQDNYFKQRYRKASNPQDVNAIVTEQEACSYKKVLASLGTSYSDAKKEYEACKSSAIITPYPSINKITGSLQGGDMIILAGTTSSGKTCMMLNLLLGMAKAGINILMFSLEMSKTQLQQRLAACELSINAMKFRKFSLSDEEKHKYFSYLENELSKLPITLYPNRAIDITTLKNIVRESKADIVTIDYLGLISGDVSKSSYERYSNISREIKLLAAETNKVILALHQLNRAYSERADKRPQISDLRDSGKIEQDADIIWLVYRPAQFDSSSRIEDMRLIVGKNRSGVSNKEIRLVFNGMNQRITEPIKIGGRI